jgi:hypothetical protein
MCKGAWPANDLLSAGGSNRIEVAIELPENGEVSPFLHQVVEVDYYRDATAANLPAMLLLSAGALGRCPLSRRAGRVGAAQERLRARLDPHSRAFGARVILTKTSMER